MTKEEALKVVLIMLQADGGCSTCGGGLLEEFIEAFPDHEDVACREFLNTYNYNLKEE